jgi:hypothetical protein
MTIIIDTEGAWPELVGASLDKACDVDLVNFSQPRHYAQCIELAASHGVDFSINPDGSVGLFRKKGTAFLTKD